MNGTDAMDARRTPPQATLQLLLACFASRCPIVGRIEAVSKEFGLAPAEAVALVDLSIGPSTVSGVGRVIGMRQNGASILIDRLVAQRLVRRRRRTGDRRVVEVHLTDAGGSLVAGLLPALEAQASILFSCMSGSELEAFASFHQRVAVA